MRAWRQFGLVALLGGVLTAAAFGQSLADAARQEQARKGTALPQRVYTNDDLSSHAPDTAAEASAADKEPTPAESKPSSEKETKKPTADELRSKILTQKRKVRSLDDHIAELQRQLDDWNNDSANNMRIAPGGNCREYYNNPYQGWCDVPAKLQADYKKTKAARDEAERILEQMQEEARRLGFRSAVYDPD